jgi:Ser-tRNA(Ala) deacylase AlaX
VVSASQEESGRRAVVLDATIFHPQGGGQPADTGVISSSAGARFLVEDVRVRDGVVSTAIFTIREKLCRELTEIFGHLTI